ncbi:MAG: isopeptide-forming domain-containing fimbrial protein, partial [Xanthomonadales bacterium]|nr:isopeptide-forming domain-containing fimbrial protein [Xanthomonadales bacterium]
MSCNTVAGHTIWFVNGSSSSIQEGCQNLLIPVEKIDKQSPAPFAAIGVPFTYTLTIPVLYDAATGTVINSNGSVNELHSIILTDDLNATGAALTYVTHDAYWQGSGTPVTPTFSNVGGVLTFDFNNLPIIPAEEQIVLEITVVLNDTPVNAPGTVFTNTVKWSFGRLIDGVYYVPLPGEWGISDPMTIVVPDLVVTKTSSETALNLGDTATFTIDVQNTGGGDAWNTRILDEIPAGMCDYDPTTAPGVSAQIFAADGVTPVSGPLLQGTDYSVTYIGTPTCQLSLTMESAAAVIGSSQYLIITYQSQLDAGITQDGLALTNVAGSTQWFSGDSSFTGRRQYDRTLTDGTPGVVDFQDSETVTTALTGYYFQKTVENLTSGADPATTAAPGDRLRYRLRLFNVDQTINGITISDLLDPNSFDLNSFAMVTPPPAGATYSFDSGTGLLEITGDTTPLNVAVGNELIVEFEITLISTLTNGTTVDNQATLSATGLTAFSDDPDVNGIAAPGDPADPTVVLIQTPGPLSKANIQGSASIGEQFNYRITVPATPIAVPLYDVRILDDLGLSNADLSFVSATVVSGGAWALSNTGSATNLIIEDTAIGIDIPANGQAVIEITVELQNTITNQSGLTFANSASYNYNRMNGNNATQTAGGGGNTSNMNVVEPDLTATKAVSFVTPAGKLPTDPATAGDILEYLITIPNGGNSNAFDTSVVDTLPVNVSLVPDSATAQINGVAVTGFVVTPTTLSGGALAWGQQNGDFTLDIPAGQTLVLTYQVTVEAVTGADINNSVYVDWTSLDGGSLAERTGAGCPTTDTLNDYCYGPATVSVTTLDNTSIAKSAVGDSYAETPASATDPIVRVGDTVTYDLTLNLQEYTTRNVVVEDDLPVGLALESFTVTGGANFSYTLAAQPAVGDTGTLRWEFGDITNTPSNDGTPIDLLVIQYVAIVVTDAPPVGVDYGTSILRNNLARLSYTGGDPAVYPDRLTATETIEVRQPQMRAISKMDLGTGRVGTGTVADPYQVNISTDAMKFQLSSCNDGLAPAYGVVITDQLAPELDETDLVLNPPVVKIGTTTLTAGPDYTYTAPPRGGQLRIALLDSAPVNPGECITVDYDIGFHTDLTVSRTWSNQAGRPEYRSLPLSQTGRIYTSTNSAEVWMTNLVNDEQLLKTLISPAEATIGDDVVYQITVPAAPMNSALDNVVVTDSLDGVLEYVSATAVDGNGASVTLTDNSVAPGDVNLGIGSIPAGEQVIITLTARVANNDQANAGVSFTNTARYTATNIPGGLDTSSTSGPVTIVEPLLAIAKTVANVSNPGAAPNVGDILRYSVSFTASGGAAGDNFSDAFDLMIEDSLSLGLAYQSGTAGVDGTGNTIVDPTVTGDGSTTAQTLIWSPADVTADIDVVEGTQVTLTYDVVVLNGVLAGQELTNSATVQWTGLDGENAFERNGTGTPVENDYFTGPASITMMTELAVSMVKSVVNVTTGQDPGTNAEPGDTLRYTIVLTNQSIVPLNNASVVDELDAHFAPGSLRLISVSDANAVTANTNDTGGANGTGIVDIRNLTLAEQGDPNDSATIVFEAMLAPSIPNGTAVLNQALLTGGNLTSEPSNQISTLISSAPVFDVWKTSQDITGDPAQLMAGDVLRYTITIKNIGNENAVNTIFRDLIPTYTTYVAGTTRLNGALVPDPTPGVSALLSGMSINAPENTTAGFMRADSTATTSNVATVTFDVMIDSDVVDGTMIANQGFVNAVGTGSGPVPEEPSDDPATTILDDPTRDVVGNVPMVDAHKTVQILVDNGSSGIVDPGDVLRYTITITNTGAATATGVVFTDPVPVNTTYVSDSVQLNGLPVGQPDGGGSPLVSGIDVSSSDLTPPLPGAGNGTLSLGSAAVITFDVQVNGGVTPGTVISNQGVVSTNEQPDEPTDADGIDSNGDQPTQVVVGNAQLLSILKQVFVIGAGGAIPGSQLEYVIRLTNIGSLPATLVVVTDDLSPMAGLMTYVAGSGTLNGSTVGVSFSGSVITADYGTSYGDLSTGAVAVVRFRVQIDPAVAIGTTLTNTGVVRWNNPPQSASASVSLDVGGTPNSATLNGSVWHDTNLDQIDDLTEPHFAGWSVALYRNNQLLATVLTDANGVYRLTGLVPNEGTADLYELRFRAAGAGPNTASMGYADSPFTDGPQQISAITVASGANLQNLNLPLWPNGVVYNSVVREPVAGARVALLNATTGAALPGQCFDDPDQQNQVTALDGFYKFDLNFSEGACPAGGAYLIEVTPLANGYMPAPSQIIPPASDSNTAPFSIPTCPGSADDAVPATAEYCEVVASAIVPPPSVQPRTADTIYYLHLLLSDGNVPGQSQVFNNAIPLDPELDGAVAITKTSSMTNVTRGTLVPYTITVT